MKQGIKPYIEENPDAFRRRARRGIPADCRWEVWKAALRLEDRARPGLYQELLNAENQWTRLIEIDIPRTFPDMPLFDREQQQSLLRILHAYANLNPDVGYCQGMNFVAGLLMFVCQNEDFRETPRLEKEEETFWMFVCLMEEGTLSGFYKRGFPLLRRYLRAFDELVAEGLPDLREHFENENVQHAVYLHQWFLTLFVNCLPTPMVLIFWDVIFCSGLEAILPITIALLKLLKEALLEMQFEDIVRFFKTMRHSEADYNTAEIGRLVVLEGGGLQLPQNVALSLSAEAELDDAEGPGMDRWDSDEGAAGRAPSADGEESGLSGFQIGSYLTRQLEEFGRGGLGGSLDLSQGFLSWWEDARDNLQRVGLGVPGRETPGRPSDGRGGVQFVTRTMRMSQKI